MEDNFYLLFGIDKVKIESSNESESTEREKLSVQTYFGDGSQVLLVENSQDEFDRQVAFRINGDLGQLENLPEILTRSFPSKILTKSGDVTVGEVDLTLLDDYRNELAKEGFDQILEPFIHDCQVFQVDEGGDEKIMVGVVRLIITLEKRENGATVGKFKPPAGYDEQEDCVQDCLALQSSDSSFLIANEHLIHPDTICGPCGRPDCPIAKHVKQELKRPEVRESCTCMGGKELQTATCSGNEQGIETIPPCEGNFTKIGQEKGDMAICGRRQSQSSNDSGNIPPPRQYCPKCYKPIECNMSQASCPYCGREGGQTEDCPRRRSTKTPIIMSLSEDFSEQNRLRPSSEMSRRPRGCPCCLKNKKKCDDCVRSKKYQQMHASSSSTLDQFDACSMLSSGKGQRPRSRYSYSMYGDVDSINRMRKGSMDSFHRLSRPRTIDDLRGSKATDGKYDADGKLRRPKTGKQKRKSRLDSMGNEQDIDDKALKRALKKGKKKDKKRVSGEEKKEMSCEEKLAEIHARLKAKRRARPRPLKALNIKSKYSYSFGKKYPGIKVGHRECVANRGLVPCNMGWLWNVPTLGINQQRVGWRPGAVTKPIKELMMRFLSSYPCDTIPNSKPDCAPKLNTYCDYPTPECPDSESPTLQVKREKGDLTITYKPLKDTKNLRAGECPYLDCPPLQIRIARDEEGCKIDDCRQILTQMGFKPCCCPNVKTCTCRPDREKEKLRSELRKLSREVGLQSPMKMEDFTVAAMENNKDVDYAFTPLAAMLSKQPKSPKKDTRASETQYNKKDYELPLPADRDLIKKGKDDGKGKGSKFGAGLGAGKTAKKSDDKGGAGKGKGAAGKGKDGKGKAK